MNFRKFGISLVIMAAMSLCLFGAMFGLWIAGFTIGLTSVLGFITLLMVPIFLTTATTAVGVIPMMLDGNSYWAPVGVTIFAGGIGSLILVVTILPVLYSKIYK